MVQLRSSLALQAGGAPAGKPLEDHALADDAGGFYVVCDGVTRTARPGAYPDPSPATLASHAFATALMRQLQDRPGAHPASALRAAVAAGNAAVAALNRRLWGDDLAAVDHLERDFAATVAVAAVVAGSVLHHAHVADCTLHHVRGDRVVCLTRLQTAGVAAWRRAHGEGDEVTLRIRREFRNRPGSPQAYGCFTGEPRAMDLLEAGAIELRPGDRLVFGSDGLAAFWEEPLGLLATGSPSRMIEIAAARDAAAGRRPDDKAVIVVDVG